MTKKTSANPLGLGEQLQPLEVVLPAPAIPPPPSPLRVEKIVERVDDATRLADILRQYIQYSRVRTIGGFMRGRCQACNVAHPAFKTCLCPHHEAVELLKEFGMEVDI